MSQNHFYSCLERLFGTTQHGWIVSMQTRQIIGITGSANERREKNTLPPEVGRGSTGGRWHSGEAATGKSRKKSLECQVCEPQGAMPAIDQKIRARHVRHASHIFFL